MNQDTASRIAAFSDDRRNYACVSRFWNIVFSHDLVWESSLFGDFALRSEKRAPVRLHSRTLELKTFASFRETWQAWKQLENDLQDRIKIGEIWLRIVNTWQTIRNELKSLNCLENVSLLEGFDVNLKDTFIEKDVMLSETIRAIWNTHNGQNLNHTVGLFGLTSFYNRTRTLHLLPFNRVSFTSDQSFIFGQGNISEFMAIHEKRVLIGPHRNLFQSNSSDNCLLNLFEYYAQDLSENKRYVFKCPSRSLLSSFPLKGPRTSCAITNGIRVQAAFTFIPDETNPLWVYQLRIDTINSERNWRGKVVLLRRHWVLTDPTQTDRIIVDGEGEYLVMSDIC